jgi:hypothetical protein
MAVPLENLEPGRQRNVSLLLGLPTVTDALHLRRRVSGQVLRHHLLEYLPRLESFLRLPLGDFLALDPEVQYLLGHGDADRVEATGRTPGVLPYRFFQLTARHLPRFFQPLLLALLRGNFGDLPDFSPADLSRIKRRRDGGKLFQTTRDAEQALHFPPVHLHELIGKVIDGRKAPASEQMPALDFEKVEGDGALPTVAPRRRRHQAL